MQNQKEFELIRLAEACIMRGQYQEALLIYNGLRAVRDDVLSDHCNLQYVGCLVGAGMLSDAESELKSLLETTSGKDLKHTVFRADVLLYQAFISLVQDVATQQAETWLREAETIFKANRDFEGISLTLYLQNLVATKSGNWAAATDKIEISRAFAMAARRSRVIGFAGIITQPDQIQLSVMQQQPVGAAAGII